MVRADRIAATRRLLRSGELSRPDSLTGLCGRVCGWEPRALAWQPLDAAHFKVQWADNKMVQFPWCARARQPAASQEIKLMRRLAKGLGVLGLGWGRLCWAGAAQHKRPQPALVQVHGCKGETMGSAADARRAAWRRHTCESGRAH